MLDQALPGGILPLGNWRKVTLIKRGAGGGEEVNNGLCL